MKDRGVLVTVGGKQVKLQPVSQLLLQRVSAAVRAEFVERGEPLEAPTYSITIAGGAVETHPHDEHSLQTDEDRAAWAAYQAATARLASATNERATRAMLLQGVEIEGPPAEWVEQMQWLGMKMPTDPRELRLAYLELEVLKTPEDTIRCVTQIMQLSMTGMKESEILAVEDLFRRSLERATVSPDATDGRGVELQPGVRPDGSGESLGAKAK